MSISQLDFSLIQNNYPTFVIPSLSRDLSFMGRSLIFRNPPAAKRFLHTGRNDRVGTLGEMKMAVGTPADTGVCGYKLLAFSAKAKACYRALLAP
jgi:hypothetical protein